MQNIKWVSFAYCNTLSKSILHFLPSSLNTSAPYPVIYNIEIHSKETGTKSISLDDGRLGQPDGVRLEDIFPVLNEVPTGLIALSVEMNVSQPKVDLLSSSCVMEIITASNSVKYLSANLGEEMRLTSKGMLVVTDAYCTSSLLIVNASASSYSPKVLTLNAKSAENPYLYEPVPQVEACTAMEYDFGEKFFNNSEAQECSWGLFRATSACFEEKLPENVAAYAVYRDTTTKRLLSVKAI